MIGFKLDNRFFEIRPKTVVISVIAGSLAYVAFYYIRKQLENRPPKKWRKIGEVTDLLCYPIKSCGWIRSPEFDCKTIGLETHNIIRDRIFMIVRTDGEFVTARQHPKLVQVMPRINGDLLSLSAPGMMNLDIDIARLFTLQPIKACVWGQEVDVVDAGEDSARWFSRYVLAEDFGLRLVFYPSTNPSRDVRKKNRIFETAVKEDTGALHDATSFMLINESSVNELNSRIKNPVTPLQFRPNIVVKGPAAFEEDSWKWVKLGDDVIFRNVKPCSRCLFINIDPETAERNSDEQPLKTLKMYRKFEKTGDSPAFGIHLGVRQQGKVKLGDAIYVEG